VTIEEYTPWQLRGSFSGHLTNVDRLNLVGDDPSMPIHENIQGPFNIIAPWHKDDRMIVETAETAIASVFADVQQMQAGQGARPDQPEQSQQPGGWSSSSSAVANLSTVKPFLRSIPNACDVLDEITAMSLLAARTVEPSGPREWLPGVTSQCGHRSVTDRKASTELNMLFMSLALVDSYTMPREELRAKAGGFALLTGAQLIDVEGVGNIGFALIGDKTITLKVFTGIYGTAADSDELVSELVLTYTLADSKQAEPDTMKKLYDASRAHVQRLKEKALSTHEGA
jgi:hypothetical protein